MNGANGDDDTQLEKKDISDFMSIITQVYSQSPQVDKCIRKLSLTDKSSSGLSSKTTSKLTSRTFPDEERFLNLLQSMINQMNSMRFEFLESVKDSLFIQVDLEQLHKLQIESIKNEEQLQDNFPKESVSVQESTQKEKPIMQAASRTDPDSSSSSTFSVVDDEKKISTENKELQAKLEVAEEDVASLEQTNEEQKKVIAQLRQLVKNVNKHEIFNRVSIGLTLYIVVGIRKR